MYEFWLCSLGFFYFKKLIEFLDIKLFITFSAYLFIVHNITHYIIFHTILNQNVTTMYLRLVSNTWSFCLCFTMQGLKVCPIQEALTPCIGHLILVLLPSHCSVLNLNNLLKTDTFLFLLVFSIFKYFQLIYFCYLLYYFSYSDHWGL